MCIKANLYFFESLNPEKSYKRYKEITQRLSFLVNPSSSKVHVREFY